MDYDTKIKRIQCALNNRLTFHQIHDGICKMIRNSIDSTETCLNECYKLACMGAPMPWEDQTTDYKYTITDIDPNKIKAGKINEDTIAGKKV